MKVSDVKVSRALCLVALALTLTADAGAAQKSRARKAGSAAVMKKTNRLPAGTWGGRGVRLEVGQRGARAEFDCARGTLEGPLMLGPDGRFDVRGTYTQERGGPTRLPPDAADGQTPPDQRGETFPARYKGSVRGKTMTLSVTILDSSGDVETFTLGHGREPVLVKCL